MQHGVQYVHELELVGVALCAQRVAADLDGAVFARALAGLVLEKDAVEAEVRGGAGHDFFSG